MNNYEKIIKEVIIPNEGIYSYDPNDPGGETCYGISRKHFPNWSGWSLVDALKDGDDLKEKLKNNDEILEEVFEFYKNEFWDKLKLDTITSYEKQKIIMDSAVNLGVRRVAKFIQKVLGVKVDGIIGPITLGELERIDEEKFVSLFKLERIKYYTNLVSKNKKLKIYFYGWIRRTINL